MAKGLLGLVGKLIGDSNTREIARLQRVVEEINALEPEVQALSADEVRAKTPAFRRRLARGESLDDLLPEAFAVAREAAWRTIGLRHYDVQLIGAMILHQGRIVEMKTGEGKTLVATLPLYLNGLALNPDWIELARAHWGADPDEWEFVPLEGVPVGRGVHLVTVNDYLARRDGGWMGPSFDALGLRVGLVVPHVSAVYDPDYVEEEALLQDDRLVHWRPSSRSDAYHADITYGTNNEFGFDYLRDNMIRDREDQVQRELNYAIIDEIDNVLIDEARTPLIISGPSEDPSELYTRFARLVQRLQEEEDYEVDARTQVVTLTEQGINKVESMLSEVPADEGLYDPQHSHMLPYLSNALHARVVYKRDKDYIVKDGQVVIVDEFTGRLLHGRRYSEGLHQAIEAKEGLAIQRESLTYGTITVQNYFRMYRKLAGMTGTAATEQEEFRTIYDLDVIVLPTNVEYRAQYGDLTEHQRIVDQLEIAFDGVLNNENETLVTTYERDTTAPQRYFKRLDLTDAIYPDQVAKFEAIVEEIRSLHEAGRPVLVGTIAVETSEHLSRLLKRQSIPHNVLNAKQHEQEALVIAQAGRPGAVTIATNMAGRGVDIILGGEPVALAARTLQKSLESRLVRMLGELADPGKQLPEEELSQDARRTVKTLTREYTAYKQALEAGGSALPVFLVDQLIDRGSLPADNRSDGVRLVRHILAGAWDEAGTLAQQVTGLSLETLSQVQRIREQFEQARDLQHYIISGLSSTYHNLLMALIRLTLGGQTEAAQELIDRYPELPPGVLETILEVRDACRGDQERVRRMGGLHVIGTERHDARRIDNQLRGRAGRQGDPGSSRFYLSLEDELMRRFGGERVQNLMRQWGVEGVPLEFGILSKTVESAQSRVEGYNFDIRKHVLEYDDVVNKQREVIYDQRWQVLTEPNLRDQVLRMVRDEISGVVAAHTNGQEAAGRDLKGLYTALRSFIPLPPEMNVERWADLSSREIEQQVYEVAEQTYDHMYGVAGHQFYESARQQGVTLEQMQQTSDRLPRLVYRQFVQLAGGPPDDRIATLPVHQLPDEVQEQVRAAAVRALSVYRDRQLMLRAVDSLWVRYLTDLAVLREGIGLRAFGQQDPLVAFRREAHDMYQQLLGQIQSQVARATFRTPVAAPRARARPQPQRARPTRPQPGTTPNRAVGTPAQGPGDNPPGRNDPCWCGSGKKYKHCHLRQDQRAQRSTTQDARSSGASKRRRRRR